MDTESKLKAMITALADNSQHSSPLEGALVLLRQVADPHLRAWFLCELGDLLYTRVNAGERGQLAEQAITVYKRAYDLLEEIGHKNVQAQTLVNLAGLHLKRVTGRQVANTGIAIELCEKALSFLDRDAHRLEWIAAQNNLAIALSRRAETGQEADQWRAIAIYREVLEVASPETMPDAWARAASNLAAAYLRLQEGDRRENLEHSIKFSIDALEIRGRNSHPASWSRIQHNLAFSFFERGEGDRIENLEHALQHAENALTVRIRNKTPWDWAETMSLLAAIYAKRLEGDRDLNLERAIHCYEAALKVRTREASLDTWQETMISLGLTYAECRDGQRTESLERALKITLEAVGTLDRDEHPLLWACAASNLGLIYERFQHERAKHLEEAIRWLDAALKILKRNMHARRWALAMGLLGNAYGARMLGDRAENQERALTCYLAAQEVRTQDVFSWEWAETEHNRGTAYFERIRGRRAENIEQAIACLKRSLIIHTRERIPERWAAAMHNLAIYFADRLRGERAKNQETAIRYCRQALEVRRRATMPEVWAASTNLLGSLYFARETGSRTENLHQATRLHLRALTVRTEKAAPLAWAESQAGLARVYAAQPSGNQSLNSAITCFEGALRVQEQSTLPRAHRTTAKDLGNLYFEHQCWQEANRAYESALAAGDLLFQSGGTPLNRGAELQENADLPLRSAYCLAKLERPKEAARQLERSRTRMLSEILERDHAPVDSLPPQEREVFVSQRLSIAELEVESRRPDRASQDDFLDVSAQLRTARAALAKTLAHIRRLPGHESFLCETELDDILPLVSGEMRCLVYLLTTSAGSLALIVHGGSPEVESLWLGGVTIEKLVAFLVGQDGTTGYLSSQFDAPNSLQAMLANMLEALGKHLIEPLASRLRSLELLEIVIIPCGQLSLLPLHAAEYKVDGQKRCLTDEFNVSYVPSARVLHAARKASATAEDHAPMLTGIGNPLPHPRPLQYGRRELEEIAALFATGAKRLHFEENAKVENLRDSLAEATHVHLACHGLIRPEEPLESCLELADGPLTLREIIATTWFRGVRLVTLSACWTAMSDFVHIPDEAIGLPAGFLQAGASGVVASLWPVDDLSTALLMGRFYRYHLRDNSDCGDAPMPPAAALRQAQRWLRDLTVGELVDQLRSQREVSERSLATNRDRTAPQILARLRPLGRSAQPFASAYYWAPFVYLGV